MSLRLVDELVNSGLIAAKQRDFEKAVKEFQKALIVLPHCPEVHFHLGNTLVALGNTQEAIHHLKAVLNLNKQHPEAHNNLARLFHKQGELEYAMHHYQEAIRYRQHYTNAELNLGLLWLAQGKHHLARHQFQTMLKRNPDFSVLYEQLAQLALQEKDIMRAKDYYQQLLKFPIHSSDTWNNIGAVFSQVGDYVQALDAFKEALSINPKHLYARNNRAAIYLQQRRLKESIWEYTLYLRLAASDPEGYYNLGVALMLSGRLNEAITAFKRTIELNPSYSEAWCNLGAIYIQQTQSQLAYQAYQRVLAIQPSDEIAEFMISALLQSKSLNDNADSRISQPPKVAPLTYVRTLFNNYADYFDKHLIQTLNYQVPEQLYRFMQPYLEAKQFNILDLGCGTGLIGQVYKPVVSTLTGVDISREMLRQARKQSIYNCLIEQDILDFLSQSKESYTLILSADTLVYFGELRAVLEGVFQIASKGAYFGFSIEWHDENRVASSSQDLYYHLKPTGRYQHELGGVRQIAENSGWQWVSSDLVKGRLHQSRPIMTALCLVKKTKF